MKYIKNFESIYNVNIGDYVICNIQENIALEKLTDFLNNNVGEIIEKIESNICIIKYNFVPKELQSYFLFFTPKYTGDSGFWLYDIDNKYLKLATPEDIKTQKIKNLAYKYNL